jgi:glutamyl-tRNA synthetase
VEWFDLAHVSRSAAQFNPEKLAWLNQQYLKNAPDARLAALVEPELRRLGAQPAGGPPLEKAVALLKDRAQSIPQLAEEAMLFYGSPAKAQITEGIDAKTVEALRTLKARLVEVAWERGAIGGAIRDAANSSGLKMPQLAMPLRRIVTGRAQTPSIDAVLELLGRETVMLRLANHLESD